MNFTLPPPHTMDIYYDGRYYPCHAEGDSEPDDQYKMYLYAQRFRLWVGEGRLEDDGEPSK